MLFIDIETVAGNTDVIPHDIYGKKSRGEYVEKAALDWVTGQVICVGIKTQDTKPFMIVGEEKDVLQRTSDLLIGHVKLDGIHNFSDLTAEKWCTFNGARFDIPYLAMRMAKNGIRFPRPDILRQSKYSYEPHLDLYLYLTQQDTNKRWAGGQTLDFFTRYFEVECKDDPISGKDIPDIWRDYLKSSKKKSAASALKPISDHCECDIIKLEGLYEKLSMSLPAYRNS
jgi:uncharacterized protein YprB with RNaseH-like and TPR domain